MKIWANTLIRNEERYLWFAVASVVDYVDKVLIWDTGSDDQSVNIIKELIKTYPNKIVFKEVGVVDIHQYTELRQQMLNETKKEADWFMILDGDEVWWDQAIKLLTETIHKEDNMLDSLVTNYRNIVGDIYHYQDEAAGLYSIDGHIGHLTIRAMNLKVPGLKFGRPHGQQGIFDENDILIQDRDSRKRKHLGLGYLHFTNVIRSSSLSSDLKVPKRNIKLKYEVGNSFPLDYYYPEVFFRPRPSIVPSPWQKATADFVLRASLEKPLKIIKRKVLPPKKGY